MCGIAGLIAKKSIPEGQFEAFLTSTDLMDHRGPDNKSSFRFKNVLLIHSRLSIIDLDPRSHQPFNSKDQNLVMVYNGEIYNFLDLKNQYSIQTATSSDTEVILEHFNQMGDKAVVNWNGIFSLAILDKNDGALHLIRDRFGVKPLYIYENDEVIAFASEAKVILDWLSSFSLNPLGLAQYLWYGNTTGSQTIINGLKKVAPGTHLIIDIHSGRQVRESKFWSIEDIEEKSISEEEATEAIKTKLEAAVKRQLVADVPLGVLLSGGIDSSSIVAFASRHYSSALDTYTVEYDYNIGGESELQRAALISRKFKTNHHELFVKSDDVKEIFSDLVIQYDEPFADAANVPLYQLAKACSEDKKVILQGDGGDEIFAGYRRYNVMDSFPFWRWASRLYPLIPHRRWKERMKRMSFVLEQPSDALRMAYYLTQDVPYKDPFQVIHKTWKSELASTNYFSDYIDADSRFSDANRVQKLLFTDMAILLPNTYLEKVDKATMLCSIEARVPFLDNDLAEFALSLPSRMKVHKGQKKYLLRKALNGIIPDEILNGPKRGFDVPYKEWLKKDLFEFAKMSFHETQSEILDTNALMNLLMDHKQEKADYGPILWKSLVLSHWINHYSEKIRL